MTWAEHLTWCKERALAYVSKGDLREAWASMKADFGNHDDAYDAGWGVWDAGLQFAREGNIDAMVEFINGFR